MYNVISCIYYFARISNSYVFISFQYPVHCFTYNFDVPFYCTSKAKIAVKIIIM